MNDNLDLEIRVTKKIGKFKPFDLFAYYCFDILDKSQCKRLIKKLDKSKLGHDNIDYVYSMIRLTYGYLEITTKQWELIQLRYQSLVQSREEKTVVYTQEEPKEKTKTVYVPIDSKDTSALRKQNEELRQQLTKSKADFKDMSELKKQNEELQKLLEQSKAETKTIYEQLIIANQKTGGRFYNELMTSLRQRNKHIGESRKDTTIYGCYVGKDIHDKVKDFCETYNIQINNMTQASYLLFMGFIDDLDKKDTERLAIMIKDLEA